MFLLEVKKKNNVDRRNCRLAAVRTQLWLWMAVHSPRLVEGLVNMSCGGRIRQRRGVDKLDE